MTIQALLAGREGAIISAAPDDHVAAIVGLLVEKRIGAVPVVEAGAVIGIFSERDVIRALADHGEAALTMPVSAVMTAPVVTVERNSSVLAALSLMTRRRFRHLPVTEDGAMVGFVSIGDLVKYRIDNIEREAAALRDYITMS